MSTFIRQCRMIFDDRSDRRSAQGGSWTRTPGRRSGGRGAGNGAAGLHRRGRGAGHAHRQRRRAVHDGRPRHDLAGVRHRGRRDRLRARARLRQPHQPGGDDRAGGHRASSRGSDVPGVPRRPGRRRDDRRLAIVGVLGTRAHEVGLGVARSTTRSASGTCRASSPSSSARSSSCS